MYKFNRQAKQCGASLVELMVALAVTLVLTSGVIQIYLETMHTARVQESLARIQENGRFTLEIIAREVRMAGYQGCEQIEEITPNVIADTPPPINFSSGWAIFGMEQVGNGVWSPASSEFTNVVIPSTFFTNDLSSAVVGSDAIVIQRASETSAYLTGNMTTQNANIQINGNPDGFEQSEVLLITDCIASDIFRASSVSQAQSKVTIAHANNVNTTNNLSKIYGPDAHVARMTQTSFFTADTGRDNTAGQPIYALYQRDLQGNVQELFEGVEMIQVLFGEDTDDDGIANQFSAPGTAGLDFANVVVVRVAALLTSNEAIASATDNRTYALAGTLVGPPGGQTVVQHSGDRRLRRVFSTTIRLRNKGLSS